MTAPKIGDAVIISDYDMVTGTIVGFWNANGALIVSHDDGDGECSLFDASELTLIDNGFSEDAVAWQVA